MAPKAMLAIAAARREGSASLAPSRGEFGQAERAVAVDVELLEARLNPGRAVGGRHIAVLVDVEPGEALVELLDEIGAADLAAPARPDRRRLGDGYAGAEQGQRA